MAKVRYILLRILSAASIIYFLSKFLYRISDACLAKGIDPFGGILGWILMIICFLIVVGGCLVIVWLFWDPNE